MFFTILTFLTLIDAVMVVVILASRAPIRSKLFWILAVLCLPIVGAVFYFLYGDSFPPK